MKRVALAAFAMLALPSWAGLADLARNGDWPRILEVAERRGEQLPLNPSEAMIAANAARAVSDRDAEARFLAMAAAGSDEDLRLLADVLLAQLVLTEEPDRALTLSLPAFGRGVPWPLRSAAAEVSRRAVETDIDPIHRASLDGAIRKLPRSLRRRLELTMAGVDGAAGRERLARLLASSTRDLVALQAAEALMAFEQLSPRERWRIAATLYRHAMYERAAPMLEGLSEIRDAAVPREETAFLRGRCAFRRGRWQEAIEWYRKALGWHRSSDKKAEIEVHIGRCHELQGDLEQAVDAAVRAVRLKTTDDRRLFLARLRLRRGEPELAEHGIRRVRSRTDRARGEVMMAVDALSRGDAAGAQDRLQKIRRSRWAIPAAVVGAEIAAGRSDFDAALELLERIKGPVGDFWVSQARLVMGGLPEHQIAGWRRQREHDVETEHGMSLWRALGRWSVLEPDPGELRLLRSLVQAAFSSFGSDAIPDFPPGLAAGLWKIGLELEAARWDPSGWPRGDAVASAWTASQMLEHGFPWRSTRTADGAWRQAGSEVPTSVLPEALRRALYPLPQPNLVREAAATGDVHWSLLAGVAREESRWDPGALSAVGARGLVQLMPATAVSVAASSGLPEPSADDLFDPGTNLGLGARELGRLIEIFDGRWAPAVAAYNAGEVQARLWLDQCGPECTNALYLLNISFGSTRTYTADVLSAAVSYRELYGNGGGRLAETSLVSD